MMATYNGEKYLQEQIDSILTQEDVDVTIRVCDDISTDGTFEILSEYSRSDARVASTRNNERLGVGLNFMQMVYEVEAGQYDYYAFSDQDDVWLPRKLITAISCIRNKENEKSIRRIPGIGVPILYCSDLLNVNEELKNPIPELSSLYDDLPYRASLLIRNRYSGCTMVFNNDHLSLAQVSRQCTFPRIHDVWMSLLAYYCGNMVVDRQHALILRRLTGRNAAGAILPGGDVKNASITHLAKPSVAAGRKTARMLLDGYSNYLSENDKILIKEFCSYANSLSTRIKWALSGEYRSLSFVDTIFARIKFLLARY